MNIIQERWDRIFPQKKEWTCQECGRPFSQLPGMIFSYASNCGSRGPICEDCLSWNGDLDGQHHYDALSHAVDTQPKPDA